MKTRKSRRRSTRSADHDVMVWATASAVKQSAIRLTAMMAGLPRTTGAIHRQLTKLYAATPAQISACHQRGTNASSSSARVNSHNTTASPVDRAINGACQIEIGAVEPICEVTACAIVP